ncbi:MAG: hypothetical protein GQF41_0665 [Candidatus Rifleibacterium amylolyticum]|nr:MAG: hypothetical protein GQF41_0665 [Candidatus Rifleibacterium amylolyticum]
MYKIDGQQRRKLLEKIDSLMMQSLLKVVHQPSAGPVAVIER